jgi:actin-related protein 10
MMVAHFDQLIDLFFLRSLKTGGVEVTREKWDEATSVPDADDAPGEVVEYPSMNILPDWTRTPLPLGAPPVVHIPRVSQTQVGA